MYVHITPPTPHQNTPFPGLNLKVGKINYGVGNLDPNWAICLKSGPKFSRSGQFFLFIVISKTLIKFGLTHWNSLEP